MRFEKPQRDQSGWCKNAYSQGQYTEAAIKGLLYGKIPLENGGIILSLLLGMIAHLKTIMTQGMIFLLVF